MLWEAEGVFRHWREFLAGTQIRVTRRLTGRLTLSLRLCLVRQRERTWAEPQHLRLGPCAKMYHTQQVHVPYRALVDHTLPVVLSCVSLWQLMVSDPKPGPKTRRLQCARQGRPQCASDLCQFSSVCSLSASLREVMAGYVTSDLFKPWTDLKLCPTAVFYSTGT